MVSSFEWFGLLPRHQCLVVGLITEVLPISSCVAHSCGLLYYAFFFLLPVCFVWSCSGGVTYLQALTRVLEGFPSYFLRAQEGHAAPARSSHLSLREPPWKKTAPTARPGAKVSAAPPGAPPRDPRASTDHPTWWLVPPDAHHGQGGKKTAQFGPWVLPPKPKS
jgi:hypothetical protein